MLTKEEIALLRENKIMPENASPAQAQYFFKVCERRKLDPFLKQIYMIERTEYDKATNGYKKSYTIQASLDGMRAIAQRNVKITSYRRSIRRDAEEIYGCCEISTADRGTYYDECPLSEYIQKTKTGETTKFWKQFPTTMIKKVAEESVLRMVAPEDLSDIYGDEEMQQADVDTKALAQPGKSYSAQIEEAHVVESPEATEAKQKAAAIVEELNAPKQIHLSADISESLKTKMLSQITNIAMVGTIDELKQLWADTEATRNQMSDAHKAELFNACKQAGVDLKAKANKAVIEQPTVEQPTVEQKPVKKGRAA